ncbi:MAG: hypothetical protein GQ535_06185 [Rhodobacteraceae bacterium]|nr:hypothetical protein [Paracoccaceae bacterium]
MAKISIQPPVIPFQLTALASLCAAQPAPDAGGRTDLNLAALMPHLPQVNMKINGQMAQLATKLTIGPFAFGEAIGDTVKLESQMQVMANSINSYVTPSLAAALKVDISAMMKLAVAAKLVLQLKAAGLDPLSVNFAASVGAMMSRPALPQIVLPPPAHLPNIKILATLPTLVKAAIALNIPLDANTTPAAVTSMLSAKLSVMAAIKPPTLSIKISPC